MGDKTKCVANWDPQVTTIFCKLCVEEIQAGNRPLGVLTAKGYQNLVDKFCARTGRPYTQKQLKNRWNNLKTLYNFLLSLLHNTGLGWDAHLKTVTASEKFWEDNTQGNKEKKALRYGPPNNLPELEIMFDRSKVSGLSACTPGEIRGEEERCNNIEKEPECSEEVTKSREHSGKGLKRKSFSPKKKEKNPMVKVMSRMVDDVISTNSVTSKALYGDITADALKEVMKLAKESGAYEGTNEHYMATKLFVKPENRAIFLTFETNEERFNWLKRCYEERN